MQDLLNHEGKLLSLQEFQEKFELLNVNYFHYFQIIAAIPTELKQIARQTPVTSEDLFLNLDNLQLTDGNLSLSSMGCKHYYKLINDCSVMEPTGVKNWREKFPNIFVDWRSKFANIYRIMKDNKLRQFQFKLLHKVITTKKELKKFNIATDHECTLCSNADSIFHTFMECNVSSSIYSSILKWFKDMGADHV